MLHTIRGVVRNHLSVRAGFGSCLGACILSLLAWLLHSWRVLTFATSAVVALAACTIVPVLPESPRWLLNNGRKVLHARLKFSQKQ